MKIFLDDRRACPAGWVFCRWPVEVVAYLERGGVTHLSLDHDLGDAEDAVREGRREVTGDDVVVWLQEHVRFHGYVPPDINVHSDNGSGKDKMLNGIRRIRELHEENVERVETAQRRGG